MANYTAAQWCLMPAYNGGELIRWTVKQQSFPDYVGPSWLPSFYNGALDQRGSSRRAIGIDMFLDVLETPEQIHMLLFILLQIF